MYPLSSTFFGHIPADALLSKRCPKHVPYLPLITYSTFHQSHTNLRPRLLPVRDGPFLALFFLCDCLTLARVLTPGIIGWPLGLLMV